MNGPTETPKDAARRLAAGAIRDGFKPQALHEYTDCDGHPLHWRIRLKHPDTGDKWIRPMRLTGVGFELGEPEYPDGKPLYRLHELAARPDETVIVCEGEWCADALAKVGVLATTSGAADSAGKTDWRLLAGRDVTIWPDNDEAGQRYAEAVAEALLALGCTVRLMDAAALDIGPKADAVDWLAANPDAKVADMAALPCVEARRRDNSGANGEGAACGRILYRRVSDIQAKPIRWFWPRRIARGKVTMLAGHPGLGKSQVTVSMAAVVSTGGLWPVDRTPCERGSVIILSAEDDAEDTIRPRLEAAGADLDRCYIVDAVREPNKDGAVERSFNLAVDIERLGGLARKIGDVALIDIDPITAYLGGVDSHKNADVRGLLAPLAGMAAEREAAIVCVSHLNKSGGNEAMLRVMGSLGFVAAARSAYLIARDPDDEARRLFLPMKNNLAEDKGGLAFRVRGRDLGRGIVTSCVEWDAEPVTMTADEAIAPVAVEEDRSGLEDAQEFLAGLLADGPLPSKQIRADADGAGHAWATIRRAQKALGIQAIKEGGRLGNSKQQWMWRMPESQKALKIPEDAHPKSLSAFCNLEHLLQPSGGDSEPVEVEI